MMRTTVTLTRTEGPMRKAMTLVSTAPHTWRYHCAAEHALLSAVSQLPARYLPHLRRAGLSEGDWRRLCRVARRGEVGAEVLEPMTAPDDVRWFVEPDRLVAAARPVRRRRAAITRPPVLFSPASAGLGDHHA